MVEETKSPEERGRIWLMVVGGILLLGGAAGAYLALREPPANSGGPPVLEEYAPPTSLDPNQATAPSDAVDSAVAGSEEDSPERESVEPEETVDGGLSAAAPATTTIPVGVQQYEASIVVGDVPGADFDDLQSAIDASGTTDTIEVHGGDFTGIRITRRGEAGQWLRIVAAEGTTPIVRPVGPGFAAFEIDGASFVQVSGFDVTGADADDSRDGAGFRIRNRAHHIRIEANRIHEFASGGVEIIESGSVAIVNNEIFGNANRSEWQASGISIFQPFGDDGPGYENIFSGNVIYDNENLTPNPVHGITDGNCIIVDNTRWLDGSYEYPGQTLIENNVCFNNGGRGVHVLKSDDVYVVNNTLYHNLRTEVIANGGGELSADEGRNVLFRNNLVWPRDPDNRVWLVRSESVAFDHNVFVQDGDPGFGSTNLSVDDPMLVAATVSPELADFAPLAGGPVVGAGNTEDVPPLDQRGAERSAPPSVGALEPG